MYKFFTFIYLFLIIPCRICFGYQTQDKSRMIADLDIIKNEIEVNYAPASWKKSYLNWDLDREIALAKEKILASDDLTSRQYQQILRDLFNSLQDLHVGVNFYSTEFAKLPFLVQGIHDHYFVVWCDEKAELPLQIGDEILAFDGQSVGDMIQEIQSSAYSSYDTPTYRHLSELQLTVREGDALKEVPQGTVEITYKRHHEGKMHAFLTDWDYLPEEIENKFSLVSNTYCPIGKNPFFHKCRSLPLYTRLLKYLPNATYGGKVLGAKKSPFPALGPITWKSKSKDFDAYVYTYKGKSIGYIRIPDFHGDSDEAEEFSHIIDVMEGRTHALVLDVMNNPGGYAYYTYALASMLTHTPLINLKEKIAITQEDVFFAIQDLEWLKLIDSDESAIDILGADVHGYVVDKKFALSLLDYTQFIKDQFKAGKFITDPYPLEGLEFIHPHPMTGYTKPILMLTNSLSFSCADLLPALLQDNKRAKTFGSPTAGAGGYILNKKYSNRFGVADFTLTGSLIYRLDGKQPIENLGVKPDFPYEISAEDFTQGYKSFIQAVNKSVMEILK